jgi:hypothetical protein
LTAPNRKALIKTTFFEVICYLRFTMLTTRLFFLVFVASLSVSIFLSAWLLTLGARWARIDGVGFKRVLVVAGMTVLEVGPGAPAKSKTPRIKRESRRSAIARSRIGKDLRRQVDGATSTSTPSCGGALP